MTIVDFHFLFRSLEGEFRFLLRYLSSGGEGESSKVMLLTVAESIEEGKALKFMRKSIVNCGEIEKRVNATDLETYLELGD